MEAQDFPSVAYKRAGIATRVSRDSLQDLMDNVIRDIGARAWRDVTCQPKRLMHKQL